MKALRAIALCAAVFTTAPSAPGLGVRLRAQATNPQRLEEKAGPTARQLGEPQVTNFKEAAPSALIDWTACSTTGEIYASMSGVTPRGGLVVMPSPPSMPVVGISLADQRVTRYVPESLGPYPLPLRKAFNVGPHGGLYELFDAYRHPLDRQNGVRPVPVILRFDRDGSVSSRITLTGFGHESLNSQMFGVFGDGSFLVTGILSPTATKGGKPPVFVPRSSAPHGARPAVPRPITAIFDQHGNFVVSADLAEPRRLARGPSTSPTLSASPAPGSLYFGPSMATLQSLMVSSPDGGIYLLRPASPAELYLISSDGRVLRRVRLETPKGAGEPTDMSMMGSSALFVAFSGLRKDGKGKFHVTTLLAAFDPSTWRLNQTYLPPPGNWLVPACAEGPDKILFFGSSKDNKLEVVSFSAT